MIDVRLVLFCIALLGCSQHAEAANYPPGSPKPYETWNESISGSHFSWLPGGCFQMGTKDISLEKFPHEKPRHEVCLAGFWIGKYEVTNAQYRHYKPAHSSQTAREDSLDGDDQPVAYVTWHDATAYADWLTQQSKGKYIFRLPTEAEWEFGCRAGTDTERYWGEKEDTACSYANVADFIYQIKRKNYHHCFDGFPASSPVGKFIPNSARLHDMLGNVWEWCEDRYGKDTYLKHEKNNPVYHEIENGVNYRVIRGGSWLSEPDSVRCAKRAPARPESKYNVLGFRLVIEVQK